MATNPNNTDNQQAESLLTKSEILSIINSLLGDSQRSRFRGLSSKSRNDLVNILQDIRNMLSENSIITINNNIEELWYFVSND